MKTISILLHVCVLFVASCGSVYYKNPNSGVTYYNGQLGGTKKIASVTIPGEFYMTGYDANMEKSFRDGAIAVGVVGSTIANSIATKASEETAQAAIAANAKAKAAAENTALQKALAAEKTKQLGMELEAGAAAAAPVPTP